MRGASIRCWELERPGLTMPVRPDPTGVLGPTPGQARGPRWRTTSRGLVVPADVDPELVEQRIVEAAAALPPDAGVTGWAALRWSGAHWFDGLASNGVDRRPVTLAVGDSTIGPQPGFEISEEYLRPHDVIAFDGMPLTTHVRSVTYLMRHAPSLAQAVTALDMAAYADLVSIDEVADYTRGCGPGPASRSVAGRRPTPTRTPGRRVRWEYASPGNWWPGSHGCSPTGRSSIGRGVTSARPICWTRKRG